MARMQRTITMIVGLAVCAAALAGPVAAKGSGPEPAWSPMTSADTFTFGDVVYPQGTPPGQAAQPFTLTNTGTRTAKVSVSLAGDQEFSIGSDECTAVSLRKGATCIVWIFFRGMTGGSASLVATGSRASSGATITVTVDSVTELITNPDPLPVP